MAGSDLDALGTAARAGVILATLSSLDHDELTLKLQQIRFRARPTDQYTQTADGDPVTYKDQLDVFASARKQIIAENPDAMEEVRRLIAARDGS